MVYCDTEQANSWCGCVACLRNVFTEDRRRELQEEWEMNQWHGYGLQVERLAAILIYGRMVFCESLLLLRPHCSAILAMDH